MKSTLTLLKRQLADEHKTLLTKKQEKFNTTFPSPFHGMNASKGNSIGKYKFPVLRINTAHL